MSVYVLFTLKKLLILILKRIIRAPFPVFDMLQLVNSMPAANIQDIILMLFIFLVLEIDLQK